MVTRKILAILISTVLLAATSIAMAQGNTDSAHRYYWNLGDLYPSEEAWEEAHARIEARAADLESLKGTLSKSSQSMLQGMREISNTSKDAARLYVYAKLTFDEDQRVPESQDQFGRARTLLALIDQATAWVDPEILAIGDQKVESFLAQEASLSTFEYRLRDTLRRRPHTMTEEGENIIAKASLFSHSPFQIYTMYTNDSIPWPMISLANGGSVELTATGYGRYRSSSSRRVFDTSTLT